MYPPSFLHACMHAEMEDYEIVGEEIVVPDMHTRKKMMFDRASSNVVWPVSTYSLIPWLLCADRHVLVFQDSASASFALTKLVFIPLKGWCLHSSPRGDRYDGGADGSPHLVQAWPPLQANWATQHSGILWPLPTMGRQDCSCQGNIKCSWLFNTSLHNVQLSRAIQEGFINASTVEDLMVIADNPKHLVDRLCYEKATVAH